MANVGVELEQRLYDGATLVDGRDKVIVLSEWQWHARLPPAYPSNPLLIP
jgi:hypothetical protein